MPVTVMTVPGGPDWGSIATSALSACADASRNATIATNTPTTLILVSTLAAEEAFRQVTQVDRYQ